ncbi:hypothetical protein AX769_16580 [Frondihabitans sp. PAMC 28766]|nr:hypothetical protein AX769_16580 [Frondihabitans sp. PAMC 28766]
MGSPAPAGGWPDWVFTVPYSASAHPQPIDLEPIADGANCQRFAYAVLELFGRHIAPHRSSELWADRSLQHIEATEAQRLDLVLFNSTADAWGAHVAVALGGELLHLCAEVGRPAVWRWSDFAARDRYRVIVGVLRVA